MVKLSDLDRNDSLDQPILAIVQVSMDGEDIAFDARNPPSFDSTLSPNTQSTGLSEREGISLLQQICSEKTDAKLSKLVVPIALIHQHKITNTVGSRGQGGRLSRPSSGGLDRLTKSNSGRKEPATRQYTALESHKMFRCLEAGATDVLTSPIIEGRLSSLPLHAYRAHKEALKERAALHAAKRLRKRSWVGFDDKRPHTYLREQM